MSDRERKIEILANCVPFIRTSHDTAEHIAKEVYEYMEKYGVAEPALTAPGPTLTGEPVTIKLTPPNPE